MAKLINKIITHERPHLDEITAIWLLKRFGKNEFSGINEAEIVFCRVDNGHTSKSAEDLEREGVLLLGIGGGRFDEHPSIGTRKQDECCATLVAKHLGINGEKRLERILKFVLNNDLKGVAQPFDLAHLAKQLNSQFPDEPLKVVEWIIVGLEAKYWEQDQFWSLREEYKQFAETEIIEGMDGHQHLLVSMVTAREKLQSFAFSEFGGKADIVVQQHPSSGNIQIFTNKTAKLDLSDLAQIIRFEEQLSEGNILERDWGMLRAEGIIEGVEVWYYHKIGRMLLNGSLTAPNVPPTRLSLESIKEIIRIALDDRRYEPSRAHKCQVEVCISTLKNPCPWWDWGLRRCRRSRSLRYQKS